MKKKPVVLLDCDGVLAQTPRDLVKIVNDAMDTNYTIKDVRDHEVFTSLHAVSARKEWHDQVRNNDWCLKLKPFLAAQKAVKELKSFCDVYCVTAPLNVSPWMHHRLMWLEEHFGIVKDEVVQTDAKFLVSGDMFVDDNPENVKLWHYHWPQKTSVLIDSPYADYCGDDVYITDDWNMIVDLARKITDV